MRIMLAVLLASLWLQTAQAGTPLPDGPHLVVPGEATVHAAPDRVRIALSVTARAARPDAAKQAAGGLVFTWPANIDYVPTFAGIDHIVLDSGMLAGRVKSLKIDGSDHKALLATVQFDM